MIAVRRDQGREANRALTHLDPFFHKVLPS
jgi:hypothetical protein